MPRYSFRCTKGHDFDVPFSTMSEGVKFLKMLDDGGGILCPADDPFNGPFEQCMAEATLVIEAPALHFLGSGWTNPVPSGKSFTRGEDPTKAAADVIGEMGAKNWVNAVKQGSGTA